MGEILRKYKFIEFLEILINLAAKNGWSFEKYQIDNPTDLFPKPFYYSKEDDYIYVDTWGNNKEGYGKYLNTLFSDRRFISTLFIDSNMVNEYWQNWERSRTVADDLRFIENTTLFQKS